MLCPDNKYGNEAKCALIPSDHGSTWMHYCAEICQAQMEDHNIGTLLQAKQCNQQQTRNVRVWSITAFSSNGFNL